MKKRAIILFVYIFFVSIIFNSCENQEKFDKVGWNTNSDPAFPPSSRKSMLKDLLTNYKLVGLKCSQLIDTVGKPDMREDLLFGYRIDEDYGNDIDPVYSKDLIFYFSKDSIITSYEVKE